MNADDVRCSRDRSQLEQILSEPTVARIVESLSEDQRVGTRRSLLAQALRLTDAIAPRETAILRHCVDRLAVQTEVELFVFASPQFNAACTAQEGDRVFVLLSSSLTEAFDEEELKFVIGHELGHHVYDHHALPIHILLSGQVPILPSLALQIGAWQRYAEISADRAGALCCDGLPGAARSLFKLSSGLSKGPDPDQVRAFLDQAADLYAETQKVEHQIQADREWMASHPFSPIRLKAVEAFSKTVAFGEAGDTLDDLERQVLGFMSLMEPGYLKEDSDAAEAMRQVFFAAAILVADAANGISADEIKAIESLLGPGTVPLKVNVDAIRADLSFRVSRMMRLVGASRRCQIVRDLAAVARADGHIHDQELTVMLDVAAALEVPQQMVYDAIRTPITLD